MDTLTEHSDAARMWGSTGAAYDGISFGLSDTISHAVQVLWPRCGERILDIGTGTGWAARLSARRGAEVIGIDIPPGMLKAAEVLGHDTGARPRFLLASSENLPFEDRSFDGIISTYGIIFSERPDAAIAEMLRVLRPGGRFALATWADDPDGYIARFFGLVGRFSEAPPPKSSPFNWGRTDWLMHALDGFANVRCRHQTTTLFAPDVSTVWEEYRAGFGPVAAVFQALPEADRTEFRKEFEAFHKTYETEFGVIIPRQALLVRGFRP